MTSYYYERYGCNLCFIGNSVNHVILEYSFKLHRFEWYSNYLYTINFGYKGRTYKRDKPGNRCMYYIVLNELMNDGIYEAAEESFERGE